MEQLRIEEYPINCIPKVRTPKGHLDSAVDRLTYSVKGWKHVVYY